MKKMKMLKIILVGHLVITLPILFLGGVLFLLRLELENLIFFSFVLVTCGWIYWSFVSPWYRRFSISRLNTKKEYFLWKRLSFYNLLLCPDNFFLNQTELWDDAEYNEYMTRLNDLLDAK